jgi:hypothetical protein
MTETNGDFDEIEISFQKEKRLRENFHKCTLSDDKNIHLVIRMERINGKNEPCYDIAIYGDGKVVYEGLKDVKGNGLRESFIEKEQLKNILDKLEDIYFFSLNDYSSNDYMPSDNHGSTKISVTLEDDTKELSFPNDDSRFSGLIQLGNFIDATVNSKQWIS